MNFLYFFKYLIEIFTNISNTLVLKFELAFRTKLKLWLITFSNQNFHLCEKVEPHQFVCFDLRAFHLSIWVYRLTLDVCFAFEMICCFISVNMNSESMKIKSSKEKQVQLVIIYQFAKQKDTKNLCSAVCLVLNYFDFSAYSRSKRKVGIEPENSPKLISTHFVPRWKLNMI